MARSKSRIALGKRTRGTTSSVAARHNLAVDRLLGLIRDSRHRLGSGEDYIALLGELESIVTAELIDAIESHRAIVERVKELREPKPPKGWEGRLRVAKLVADLRKEWKL